MHVRRPWLMLICGLVAACGASEKAPPSDAVILPGAAMRTVLTQCSRDTPRPGDGAWQPGWADIAAMEALIPQALATEPRAVKIRKLRPPAGWLRQYVGIVRHDHRFIYGNFFPNEPDFDKGWREHPMIVCDGGPAFFGVEYDVGARHLDHLAFNGEG